MKHISRLIKEEINKFIINESLSSVVYHFTSFGSLYDIINSDSFYLPSSYGSFSDDFDNKKKFYISFTRQRNGKLGYSRNNPVRITLDGDLLNYNFKGKPINYWGKNSGKHSYFSNPSLYGSSNKIDYYQSNTENEDRLFSNEPVIYNFHKYIKRIDVLINKNKERNTEYARSFLCSIYRNLIHIYDNEDDFNNQSKNDINSTFSYEMNNSNLVNRKPNSSRYDILNIIYFMTVIEDVKNSDLKKYSAMKLKEYGLEKYINYVVKEINSKNHYTTDDLSIRDEMKRLHKDNRDMEDYVKVSRMVKDLFQKYGFNNEYDAKKYIKEYYQKKYDNMYGNKKYDYDKKISLMVLSLNGFNYILPFPDKTSFFELFPYSKDILLNEVPYRINSHNSKDDEYFKKYLMHLVKSNVSVSKMFQIINKMDIDDDMKAKLLDYSEFKYMDLTYNQVLWGHFQFVNDEERKNVENLFVK